MIDPPVSTLDPSVLTVEENYDRAPSPDQFGSPSLPNLVSSSWNEFDFVFNQDGFNQPEPQTPPTPLIDFELSSTDDLERGGKSQTEKENNQEGRDQGQDRDEHISHGGNVDCTDGALRGENCQDNQSEDTPNVEGLGQSPRVREEAQVSVEPSLDLAMQETSLSTPKGQEDTMDVSSGTGNQQTQTIQEGQPSPSNPAPTKRKRKPVDWPGLGEIVDKVANPTEIYECLRCRAPDGTSPARLMFLTYLFFHYGGPHAFAETGAALSALYQTEDNDITSVGGTVRALVSRKLTNTIERRAFLVRLCKDRFERQEMWERQKQPHQCRPHQPSNRRKATNQADIRALKGMIACAYPSLKPESAEYCIYKTTLQKTMNEGTNWFKAQQRRPSITWMFPRNMSEKR